MLEDLVLDVMNRMIEEQVRFKMKYPDYPLSLEKLDTKLALSVTLISLPAVVVLMANAILTVSYVINLSFLN